MIKTMDGKFNRYNRYSDDFDNEMNQPPVTPKKSGQTFTSDQLRDDYEKREKEFQARLEKRYGHNHVAGTSRKPNNESTTANDRKKLSDSKPVNRFAAAAKEKGKNVPKNQPNERKKSSGVTGNSNKTASKSTVKQNVAYRERGAGGPSPEVILKARKLKAKKIRRAKMRRRIAALLIVVVALGILGHVGYGKLQAGDWLDVNFMIEPTAELDYDKMKSEYVYLYNIDENRTIAGKRIDDKMYPASLTKMMTAIVTIEKAGNPGHLNDTVKVPKYLMEKLARENASVAGFSGNEEVSYMDLLYGVMLPSGGDACLTIADQMFGSEAAMVKVMNEKAAKLHMDGTHFMNTVGLHDPNHYSTPRDMAKLLRYGLKNETFKKIISTEQYTSSVTPEHPQGILMENTVFEKIKTTKAVEEKYGSLVEDDGYYADKAGYYDPSAQYNKNYENPDVTEDRFLGDNDLYVKGGKSGYTLEAHLCLATYGEIDGKSYILITGKAYGNPKGEPFNMYDALYAYGQVHQAHVDQENYINEKLWRRMYVSLFTDE